jgi:hypothetical protein
MSEIPALRDALVGAAARRARRRRRRAVTIVAWTAVAAAVAAVLALGTFAPRDRERAVTPGPSGLLERAFPVFARAERDGDAAPKREIVNGVPRDVVNHSGTLYGMTHLRSRLVLDDNGGRAWLVAGKREGEDWLCFVQAGGSSGCSKLTDFARDGGIGWSPPRGHEPGSVSMVLPAGATDTQVTLADGRRLTPALHDGVALVRVPRAAVAAGWTDAAGTRHITRIDRERDGRSIPEGCPRLDPLPPDAEAQARRAALMASDYLYPDLAEAEVTGVTRVGPGLCTRSVTDRSLLVSLRIRPGEPSQRQSASLTQGRLLVGMEQGEMTVWMIQH